jgi:transposase
MLTQDHAVEIRVSAKRETSIRDIARQTGLSRNTARRYLRDARAVRYEQREHGRRSSCHSSRICWDAVPPCGPHCMPATVLLRELRERGYTRVIS